MPVNTTGWNRLRYTIYAPMYDMVAGVLARPRRIAMNLVDVKPGERLLIDGCGTGLDLPMLPQGVEIVAVDLSPAMVDKTRRRASALRLPVDVRTMNAEKLEFPDGSFDVVFLHLVLAVVPDPVCAAREASRVLKPGGRISILDKFLPDDRIPTLFRQTINFATNALFTDINRRLGPILDAASLRISREEPALLGDMYKAVIATKR